MVSRKGKDNTGRKGANETGFLFLLKLVKILTIVLTKGKKRDKIIYGLWLPKRRDTACETPGYRLLYTLFIYRRM